MKKVLTNGEWCDSISERSREREQIAAETDEVWMERRRKLKNFAQNGVWKILGRTPEKVLDKHETT